MPKITNPDGSFALEMLARAGRNDPYSMVGDISTTSLIGPARLYQLRKRHDEELEEPVDKLVWSLFGQGVHSILERAAGEDTIVEQRFTAECLGWVVSGQIDVYHIPAKTLYDYKVTKVWSWKNGPSFEWTAQGNVNRWLLKKNGHQVDRLANILFLKDWDKHQQARAKQPYPARDVMELELPVWEDSATQAYIESRVRAHQAAKLVTDEELPFCTEEETWKGRRCSDYCVARAVCGQANGQAPC